MKVQLIRDPKGRVIAAVIKTEEGGIPVEPTEMEPGSELETVEVSSQELYGDIDRLFKIYSK